MFVVVSVFESCMKVTHVNESLWRAMSLYAKWMSP